MVWEALDKAVEKVDVIWSMATVLECGAQMFKWPLR